MIEFLVGLTLYGQIYFNETNGRVGVRLGVHNNVTHVYKFGTNCLGLIYEGDQILESNGKQGEGGMLGPSGETIHIKLKRKGEIKEFDIERVPVQQVKDK